MLLPPAGKILDCGKDAAQQFGGRNGLMPIAKLLQPLDSELLSVAVKGVGDPISAKEHRFARLQSQRQRLVARRGEQTRRNPAEFQSGAPFRAQVKRAGHARAGDLQFLALRVEDRILDGRVPAGHPANHQPPVQRRKDIVRRGACLVHPAQRSHRQGRIQCGRQALAGDIAQVQAQAFVRQFEIIQEVATHCGNGLEFVRNPHRPGPQRFGGKHHALDRASFFQFLFPQFLNGMQFQRERSCVHSSVRKGAMHRRGKFGGRRNSNRAAAFRCENAGRCFLTQLFVRIA